MVTNNNTNVVIWIQLENTQSENENIQEEFDKIQTALSRFVRVKGDIERGDIERYR